MKKVVKYDQFVDEGLLDFFRKPKPEPEVPVLPEPTEEEVEKEKMWQEKKSKDKEQFNEILTDVHSKIEEDDDFIRNAKDVRDMPNGLIRSLILLKDGTKIKINHFFHKGYYDVQITMDDNTFKQRYEDNDKKPIGMIWDIQTIAHMFMDELKED